MPVDYSKWDKMDLGDSDSDEAAGREEEGSFAGSDEEAGREECPWLTLRGNDSIDNLPESILRVTPEAHVPRRDPDSGEFVFWGLENLGDTMTIDRVMGNSQRCEFDNAYLPYTGWTQGNPGEQYARALGAIKAKAIAAQRAAAALSGARPELCDFVLRVDVVDCDALMPRMCPPEQTLETPTPKP